MSRFDRRELQQAFERYQAEVRRACAEGDWGVFADLFTEDASYVEHLYGRFQGREEIRKWITRTMSEFPGNHMPAFPIKWSVIDEDKGWIVADVVNQMADPGDGTMFEASNITILHYAGDGLFALEEDVYNPMEFMVAVKGWCDRARELGNLPEEAERWMESVTAR